MPYVLGTTTAQGPRVLVITPTGTPPAAASTAPYPGDSLYPSDTTYPEA